MKQARVLPSYRQDAAVPNIALSRPFAAFASVLTVVTLTGCSTDSPPQHSERLQKASGLKAFQIETTKELWETTADQKLRPGHARARSDGSSAVPPEFHRSPATPLMTAHRESGRKHETPPDEFTPEGVS
ncbi:hypothetical protein ACIOWI_32985 [Streptomyces sp. NPDC087659]|uniref:hypothetical protein n=1 Tax=Streptomyces sp. NPDC087659 TaxID=3365801 RepID=UPI0037F1A2D3